MNILGRVKTSVPPRFRDEGARERGGAGAAYAKAPYHFLGNVGERQGLKNL